jgi:predicted RNA-binding Zn-ribbon protein involved in translation (DUF1610 family)
MTTYSKASPYCDTCGKGLKLPEDASHTTCQQCRYQLVRDKILKGLGYQSPEELRAAREKEEEEPNLTPEEEEMFEAYYKWQKYYAE